MLITINTGLNRVNVLPPKKKTELTFINFIPNMYWIDFVQVKKMGSW